jgi:RNA polymerase sigma-70 factor, ECF subfamily
VSTAVPLEEAFEALRGHLERVAYSTLGSRAEAEDVVQEAWLRLQRTDPAEIRDLRAWLVTVVGRLALDALGSARARREHYVGEWLPEPVVDADPADRATLDDEVSLALLRVLERLSPAERTAFVLHDVFGYAFGEVAAAVGRTPQATRQLASRARRQVEGERPRFPATPAEQRAVVEAFAEATAGGDLERLLGLLDPGVVLRSDGGGLVPAARRPLEGAAKVSHMLLTIARKARADVRSAIVAVNGQPGILMEQGGRRSVLAFTVDDGRITAIDIVRNPEKLAEVPSLEAFG